MAIKTKKLSISILVAFVLTILPVIVFASSYYSTLSFIGEHDGPTRTYDGNNIGISMTAYCNNLANASTTFTVELHRKNFLGSTYIGSSTFPRNGFDSDIWTSIGSGDYFFRFLKARDGVVVNSDDVYMFSN